MIKIGIPLIGSIAWHGGITYVESVINSLKTVDLIDRPKVFLLVDNTSENNLKLHINSITLADGLIFIGKDFFENHFIKSLLKKSLPILML